jgi:hypothetical protein
MKLNSKIVGIILIIFLFGGIGIAKGLNIWHTESSKEPVKFKEGEFAGQYNPADIRGSYSFGDISNSFNVPVEDLAKAFGVNNMDNTEAFKVKELENIYAGLEGDIEIGTASVRYFTALYTDLPYEMDEEVYLPEQAVNILKFQDKIGKEEEEYISSHTVDISNIKAENNSLEHDSEEEEENKVKGKTTFKEVLDLGVSQEDIEKIINGEIPNKTMSIRDYCMENKIEFSEVKLVIQEKIDEMK